MGFPSIEYKHKIIDKHMYGQKHRYKLQDSQI